MINNNYNNNKNNFINNNNKSMINNEIQLVIVFLLRKRCQESIKIFNNLINKMILNKNNFSVSSFSNLNIRL